MPDPDWWVGCQQTTWRRCRVSALPRPHRIVRNVCFSDEPEAAAMTEFGAHSGHPRRMFRGSGHRLTQASTYTCGVPTGLVSRSRLDRAGALRSEA